MNGLSLIIIDHLWRNSRNDPAIIKSPNFILIYLLDWMGNWDETLEKGGNARKVRNKTKKPKKKIIRKSKRKKERSKILINEIFGPSVYKFLVFAQT